jgi:hypothetical protein
VIVGGITGAPLYGVQSVVLADGLAYVTSEYFDGLAVIEGPGACRSSRDMDALWNVRQR